MSIHAKLVTVQSELKAPKGQTNSFGKYKYRSCEDILEALKPILKDQGLTLTLSDDIWLVGTRFYVKATATISAEKGESLSVTAYAREEESKKGMDGAQVTGAASSYARKYALNGLFCIDDTKDADTMDNTKQEKKEEPKKVEAQTIIDALKPCKTTTQVEVIAERASKYTWSVEDKAKIEEAKKSVLDKLLFAS